MAVSSSVVQVLPVRKLFYSNYQYNDIIMKMKFFSTLSSVVLMASALFLASCSDDDNAGGTSTRTSQILLRTNSLSEGAEYDAHTLKEVKLSFNNMVTINPNVDITLNGTKLTAVSGSTTTMDVVIALPTLQRGVNYTLDIPQGAFIGKVDNQAQAPALSVNFTTKAEPTPLSNETTALMQMLGWGWNLGNHFETSDMSWGYWDGVEAISAELFNNIAAAGAKTVRIPVTWDIHMEADGTIKADFLNEVAGAVDKALAANLYVIINSHHDSYETNLGNAANNPEIAAADQALIVSIWTQVATKFKDYGEKLIFETVNEVHAGDNWSVGTDGEFALLNQFNQAAVDAIRATGGNNATRWIGVAGYAANISLTANHFQLPNDPANRLMVSAHFYDPSNFTLSPESKDGYTEWGHTAASGKSSGDNEENYVEDALKTLQQKYIANNIPVYIGEYGCVIQTSERSNLFRNYYLEYVCRTAYLCNLPVMMWDNNSIGGGNEKHGVFSHSDGSYINGQEQMVKTMIKAATSDDKSYTLESIYNNAPK